MAPAWPAAVMSPVAALPVPCHHPAVVPGGSITAELQAGALLAGKYRVERLLGRGGMGVVVEARHVELDERVALKFLLPERASDEQAVQRFLREARAAVKIKSPHVARVSDVGRLDSGSPYIVMEYLEGSDAARLLESDEELSAPDAIDMVIQTCDAIAEAHSHGIVHRDLKPANLFVTRHADGTPFVKVLDFGISRVIVPGGVDSLTQTRTAMGSAHYMSPEQIRDSRSVDHRADVYALGITLYELLSGSHPFVAESFPALCLEIATGTPVPLADLRPDLPADLCAVVEKAHARERSERYQTTAELALALAPFAPARSQPIIERLARAQGLLGEAGRSESRISIPDRTGEGRRAPSPFEETLAAPELGHDTGPGGGHASTRAPTGKPASRATLVLGAAALLLAGAIAFTLGARSRQQTPEPAAETASPAAAQPLTVLEPSPMPMEPVEPVEPEPRPAASASVSVAPRPPLVPPKTQPRPAAGAGGETPKKPIDAYR
jgi:eukaryotic-like serine/threonine-protein kinase